MRFSRTVIGAFAVLAALATLQAFGRYQNRQEQMAAYDAALRHAKTAESANDAETRSKFLGIAITSLKEIEDGHPKHEEAQELIEEYEGQRTALKEEVAKDLTGAVAAYEKFVRQIDPKGITVSSIGLDENVESRIVVVVGAGWGLASNTEKLDLANTLWQNWGQMCGCSVPGIKFQSQTGRDLGGTGTFGTAIKLKD